MFSGDKNNALYQRFKAVAAVFRGVEYVVDSRNPHAAPEVTIHKYHSVDKYKFTEVNCHPSLMHSWIFVNKYSRFGGRFSIYEEGETSKMAYESNIPQLLLLCKGNHCQSEINKINWVVDKYLFHTHPVYAKIEQTEDTEYIVKRFKNEKKPLILFYELKNRAHQVFLLRDNIEDKYLEAVQPGHVEEFVRNRLLNYEKMKPYTLSESAGKPDTSYGVERITGDNFASKMAEKKKGWMILIHEGKKSEQQALHNFGEWARLYKAYFSQLGLGTYNQLENSSPLELQTSTPTLIYVSAADLHRIKTQGVVGIPVEPLTDKFDEEGVYSLLRANYKV